MHQLTQLENGLTVATAERPEMASVCLGIWVEIGSRHETAAENGAAHFIEHMLFKGTPQRDARAIVAEVEGLGGYLNAYTSEDHTCYYARGRADRWNRLLDVLWDMFANSTFPATEIRREREVIKEERAMYLDDPSQLVQELLGELMWPNHPLGRPIEGTEASLDRLDRRTLRNFAERHYGTQNTCIVAAGNLPHDRLVRAARRLTKAWTHRTQPAVLPAPNEQDAPRFAAQVRDIEQTQIALGIKTCPRADSRRHGLRLLNAILAENMSSRLYQVLRERHGLAYSVYSTPGYYEDTGDLTITAGVDAERLPKVLDLLRKELRRFKKTAPDAAELRQAKEYVIGQFDLYLESTENHMTWLGENILAGRDLPSPAAIKNRLKRVTAAQVRQAAVDFLRPERASLAVVTPDKGHGLTTRDVRF